VSCQGRAQPGLVEVARAEVERGGAVWRPARAATVPIAYTCARTRRRLGAATGRGAASATAARSCQAVTGALGGALGRFDESAPRPPCRRRGRRWRHARRPSFAAEEPHEPTPSAATTPASGIKIDRAEHGRAPHPSRQPREHERSPGRGTPGRGIRNWSTRSSVASSDGPCARYVVTSMADDDQETGRPGSRARSAWPPASGPRVRVRARRAGRRRRRTGPRKRRRRPRRRRRGRLHRSGRTARRRRCAFA